MFDVETILRRHTELSRASFGPGEQRNTIAAHISQILRREIAAAPSGRVAAAEWIKVALLALDGCARAMVEAGDGWPEIRAMIGEAIERERIEVDQILDKGRHDGQ